MVLGIEAPDRDAHHEWQWAARAVGTRDQIVAAHRVYPPATVTVLRVIKAAQRLGFTLDEVADLLEVSHIRAGQRTDAGLQARARVKLAEVDAKLVELTTVRDTLRAALDAVLRLRGHEISVPADSFGVPARGG
jgi:DNA-binding transcriptional MerR regulator